MTPYEADRALGARAAPAEPATAAGADSPGAPRPEPAAARPVILLASTCAWPSAPKLAVALAGAGCEVFALAPHHHPLGVTVAVRRRLTYRALAPLRSLARAIVETDPDLILACDERVVEHLHRLHARTSDHRTRQLIERSLGDPRRYGLVHRRLAVIDTARDLGIPVPATAAVMAAEDLSAWGGDQPFPWVLKTDGSWGGLGVRIVSSPAAARSALRRLRASVRPLYALRKWVLNRDPFWLAPWLHQSRSRVTVQAFIEGRPANCLLAAWRGEVLGAIGVEVMASDGETGPASIVRLARDDQMVEAGARLVGALGLSGLVGFDFMIEDGGRAVLLEINPRATAIGHLRLGPGRDLVGALAARIAGRPAPDTPAETACEVIALFPQAQLQAAGHPALEGAYDDRPLNEPQLTQTLLDRRWPRRSRLAMVPMPAE
jgi:hypothetical protein